MFGALPFAVQGLGYGFLAGVTIGPFLGYVINVVLTSGWRSALPLITIPPLVDAPIIVLMLFVLGSLPEYVLDIMSIGGGSFILWLGWSTWREARKHGTTDTQTNLTLNAAGKVTRGETSGWVIYLRGVLVNALNPAPYLFWSTVSGPILLDGLNTGGAGYAFAFLLGYYVVFLSLIFALMRIVERIGELDNRFERAMFPVTVGLLVVLGFGLVATGVFDLVQRLA